MLGKKISVFTHSRPFPTCFFLKRSHNGIFFHLFSIFSYFLGFCFYSLGGNEMERQFLFSLFLGIFQPILTWNGAITVLFNLLTFFSIFLEFSLTRQVGTKRKNNFNFLSLSLFQPILAWNHAIMVFFIFLNFYATFLEFSTTHRVGTERNDNFYFLSLVDLFHLILAWNEATLAFFFFLFFWSFVCPVG